MAFLRFSRDPRGYEHFYIVHSTTRRGKSRSRILYWFRTPPGVKVGREPFDEGLRRALEAQNPDVTFDWQQLIDTPIPPPVEPERWRERRRAEKAAKLEERAKAGAAAAADVAAGPPAGEERPLAPIALATDEGATGAREDVDAEQSARTAAADVPEPLVAQDAPVAVAALQDQPARRRRRRRGRRGRRPLDQAVLTALDQAALTALDQAVLTAPPAVAEASEPGDRGDPDEPHEPREPFDEGDV